MGHRVDVRSGSHPRPHTRQHTATTADVTRLDTACNDLIRAMHDVAALLPEPTGRARTGTIGRHLPESSEPWQGAAAAVYWTVHFGARRLEDACRVDVGLAPHDPPRGGSTTNTSLALRAIANTAPTLTAGMLSAARRRIEGWRTAIEQVPDIDLADAWIGVPRQPGALPPACPYCDTFALRMATARELVRCFNPDCRDTDGAHPTARMERGRLSGDGILVFGDGLVVHYRQEAQTT